MATQFVVGQNPKTISLEQAIENHWVTYEVRGNGESTHYLKPIILQLENQTSSEILVKVENGQIFNSDFDHIQDIIITQEELIALQSNENKTTPLMGMCTQIELSASNADSRFQLGEMAKGDLLKLSKEIQRGSYQNTLGQHALWTLTDKQDLNSIIGFEEEKAIKLKTFVAELQGIPVPEYSYEAMETYSRTPVTKRSTKGHFTYTFSKKRAVTIALFDSENRLIREIYNNPNELPEEHRIDFAFDIEVDPSKEYYVRLLADDEIQMTLKMKARHG